VGQLCCPRVQGTIWCQFQEFWFGSFCGEHTLLKFYIRFWNFASIFQFTQKGGGQIKWSWRRYDVFYETYFSWFFLHFWEKHLGERKGRNIARQCSYNWPLRQAVKNTADLYLGNSSVPRADCDLESVGRQPLTCMYHKMIALLKLKDNIL